MCMDSADAVQVPVVLRNLQTLQALGQASTMPCELWLLSCTDPVAALADVESPPVFVGVANIPISFRPGAPVACILAGGWFPLNNVLNGMEGASMLLHLSLHLGAEVGSSEKATMQPTHLGSVSVQSSPGKPLAGSRAEHAMRVERTEETALHAFQVNILSMTNLPDVATLQAWGLPVPSGRYIRCVLSILILSCEPNRSVVDSRVWFDITPACAVGTPSLEKGKLSTRKILR